MSLRFITRYGAIETARPYEGIAEGEVFLDSLEPEQAAALLPDIIREFDARLSALEGRDDD